jgi:hypothetical protein
MSQIFLFLKEQALEDSDEMASRLLDECIELWASMLESSARRGKRSNIATCCCMQLTQGVTFQETSYNAACKI